jgi:hypothetical protein
VPLEERDQRDYKRIEALENQVESLIERVKSLEAVHRNMEAQLDIIKPRVHTDTGTRLE